MATKEVVQIGVELDKNSQTEIARATSAIEQQFVRLNSVFAGLSAKSIEMGKSIKAFADEDAKAIQKLRDEYNRAADAASNLGNSAKKASTSGGINAEGLRRTGGALSQLGLGDLGGGISRIGDIAQIGKEADNLVTSLGPLAPALSVVGGAVIGFQVGLKVLEAELNDSKKALEVAVSGLDAYYKALEQGTTDSIKNQLDALKKKNETEVAELNQLKEARDKAFKSEQGGFGGDLAARIKFGLGDATGAFKSVDERIKALETSTGQATGQIDALNRALGSTQVQANDAAKALVKAADDSVKADTTRAQLLTLSTDAAKAKVKSEQDEIDALTKARDTLVQSGDKSKEVSDKVAEYNQQIAKLGEEQKYLTNTAIPLIAAREAETKAMQAQLKEQEKAVAQRKANDDAMVKAIQNRDSAIEQAETDAANKRKDIDANLQLKLQDIEQSSAEKRADIQKKLNDNIIEIARKAAEDAQDSLTKLEQQQADLALNMQREDEKAQRQQALEDLNTQIKVQREETKALTEHYRELDQIRRDAQRRERSMILNRDFAALFESRQQTTDQLSDSNRKFGQDQQDRIQAQKQEADDNKRARAQERQERLIAYQHQLADAKTAYQRELQQQQLAQQRAIQQANLAAQQELQQAAKAKNIAIQQAQQAAQRELQVTNQAETAKIATLNASAIAQINIINQTENQKLQIYYNSLKQARQIAGQASTPGARGSGSGVMYRAGGGELMGGNLAIVNEPWSSGRESWTSGGQTANFPPEMGLFIPSQSGTVNANNGGSTGHTFYITSHDPMGVRQEVLNVLNKVTR